MRYRRVLYRRLQVQPTISDESAFARQVTTAGPTNKTIQKERVIQLMGEEKAMFQLRSSRARIQRTERLERVGTSISCVFSIRLFLPTPPASTKIQLSAVSSQLSVL